MFLSAPFRSFPLLSAPFRSFPLLSAPFRSFPLLSTKLNTIILLVSCNIFFISANAQKSENLSLNILPSDFQFSENELIIKESLVSFYDVEETSNASLANSPTKSNEFFTIPSGIAGMMDSVTFIKSFTTSKGYDGLTVWTGTNGKDFLSVGEANKNGQIFKTIYWSYNTEEYLFFTLDGTNGVAIRESTKPETECTLYVNNSTPAPDDSESIVDLCADSECEATVNVLIVQDIIECQPEWGFLCFGIRWFRSMIIINNLTINQQVLNNSNIGNLTLNYFFRYIEVDNSISAQQDYDNLIVNDDVEDARLEVGADLVQLIEDNPGDEWGTVAGIATLGNEVRPGVHSIVLTEFIGAIRYTSIHEIGHNFGAEHNTIDNCGPVDGEEICGFQDQTDEPCANAFRLTLDGNNSVATVLARSANFNRIPHISNLNVDWVNVATGTASDNNAIVMRTRACRVAKNYNSEPSLSWGSFPFCLSENNQGGPITVRVLQPSPNGPGSGPYTYKWRWEVGREGQNSKLSFVPDETNSSLIVPQYVQISPGITIYVEVTNELGEKREISRYLPIDDCGDANEFSSNILESPNNVIFYDMLGRVIVELKQASYEQVLDQSLELNRNLVPHKCVLLSDHGFVPYPFLTKINQ